MKRDNTSRCKIILTPRKQGDPQIAENIVDVEITPWIDPRVNRVGGSIVEVRTFDHATAERFKLATTGHLRIEYQCRSGEDRSSSFGPMEVAFNQPLKLSVEEPLIYLIIFEPVLGD